MNISLFGHVFVGLLFTACLVLPMPSYAEPKPTFRISEKSGTPIVVFFHGRVMNDRGTFIEPTQQNIKSLIGAYIASIEKTAGNSLSPQIEKSKNILTRKGAKDETVEIILSIKALRNVLEKQPSKFQVQFSQTIQAIKAIEAWATSSNDSRARRIETLPLLLTPSEKTSSDTASISNKSAAMSYVERCREAEVPIPPDWGSQGWELLDVLPKRYTFSQGTPGRAEVWVAEGKEVEGACFALPRYRLTNGKIGLLGIICNSYKTGKACFWDNIDKKTGARFDVKPGQIMKIADIEDGDLLGENCTNCHRGENVYVIHPGTPLDVKHKYKIGAQQRYEPISTQPTWGNPAPLIKKGDGACGACHEIPGLYNNVDNANLVSAYCTTVLEKAANLTMPFLSRPAGWDNPSPAYAEQVNFLKDTCSKILMNANQN